MGINQRNKKQGFRLNMLFKKSKPTRRKHWTEEENEKLRNLFEEYEGDVVRISKELNRGERSVRMRLFFMSLIGEGEVD
ncbi:SANT/Myb-like DNA-binding domain-containing protein [Candidatus Puniceispirillum sp.]|nr:SANT/Myb-like DNA-binding domain-containing protein [Candidatus Puniceispirillum sp.]